MKIQHKSRECALGKIFLYFAKQNSVAVGTSVIFIDNFPKTDEQWYSSEEKKKILSYAETWRGLIKNIPTSTLIPKKFLRWTVNHTPWLISTNLLTNTEGPSRKLRPGGGEGEQGVGGVHTSQQQHPITCLQKDCSLSLFIKCFTWLANPCDREIPWQMQLATLAENKYPKPSYSKCFPQTAHGPLTSHFFPQPILNSPN